MGECLVEVVHLRQDADRGQDHEDVGRRVRELVVAGKGELQRDAKGLDRHDGDGADGGADGQVDERALLAVRRGHLVDHDDGEDCNEEHVEEEACERNMSAHCTLTL